MSNLHILTRCTRPDNLASVQQSLNEFKQNWTSLYAGSNPSFELSLNWWVLIDTTAVKDVEAEILRNIQIDNGKLLFLKGDDGDFGHSLLNYALDKIDNGFIYILDDDNILHPNFPNVLKTLIQNQPVKQAIVFSQKVDGKDWTGLDIREAKPENTKVQGIDMAQFILTRELISDFRFQRMEYKADGTFIEAIHSKQPESFCYTSEVACYYNYLSKTHSFAPKVLFIGEQKPELATLSYDKQSKLDLDVCYSKDDSNLYQLLRQFQPDVILSSGQDWKRLSLLNSAPQEIRKKWLHTLTLDQYSGAHAYDAAMTWIMSRENPELISFFTPVYNIGKQLLVTYQSLKDQTYQNWEWVIVNDSTDGGRTLKIAESLAASDNRVSLYDFRYKSKGNVGEAKYRAAMLAKGEILAELDHDDYLTPQAADILVSAAQRYPQAGFFYSDFAEIDSNWESLTYPEGHALGYGSYRQEECLGKSFKVANSININPKTVRHIVGMPNHIRAWRRSTYLEIRGHNRKLNIADDYEIVLQTFFKTLMLRIPKLCYLQHINSSGSNTQNRARAEIQRRVASISYHYKEQIKNRFEELGLRDWAYEEDNQHPLNAKSRYGLDEGYANLIDSAVS